MGREHQVLAQVRHAGLVDVVAGMAEMGGNASQQDLAHLAGSEDEAIDAGSTLADLGLVGPAVLSGERGLTALGHRVARLIQESRGPNGADRHEAVARGLLTWISSSPLGRTQSSDFLEDPAATAFGVCFAEHEVEQAEEYLVDHGLITGTGSSGGLVRVEATSRGRQFLRDLRPFDEQLTGVPMMSSSITSHITVGGDMNGVAVATGSHHTRQHASQTTITVTTEQRQAVVDELQQILDGLPADAPQVAREAVSTALAETTDPQTTHTVDDIKTAVTQASATLAANAALPWIAEHGMGLMQQLAAVASMLG
ncbi:hypothetical protein [Arsenicicoccus dermatophilus]|uniref:hypothetical protein n=1 Tax=Arsenicicoccus dermatophilus TaxID=1076331 RepID=UPI001F4CFC4B|nr:hypothetical protein [Arsenicicoccus dermatophilus]MCH8614400.1 hypothetical protein [Arsenicicoccus dermatophilus]